MLKCKASELALSMGLGEWKCTEGWLHRWKKRHGIVFKSMSGERAAVNEEVTNALVEDVLKPTLKDYDEKDVFNLDESGLLWRLLPNKTLAFKGEKCHGGKKLKERITLLMCCNMNRTEKRPLFVIGKFMKPKCFRGVKVPVDYKANAKAWMTSEIFKSWLVSFDREMQQQHRQVLLVLNNCSSHKLPPLRATKVLFLPPNATSKLHPLDVGIIRNVKYHYRLAVVSKLLGHIDAGGKSRDFKFSLLGADSAVKESWDKVSQPTIANSFQSAGFCTSGGKDASDSSGSQETDPADMPSEKQEPLLARLFKEFNISPSDYFSVDDDVVTSGPTPPTMPAPSTSKAPETVTEDASDGEDDCGEEMPRITSKAALDC
ncbi:hypothetical protein ACOMHN_050695 [Nucella lapillus]